ncbi:MAG: MotA/TolQ/ExbB proton channel family protein [Thermosynechococcaceae cyanobacterium]
MNFVDFIQKGGLAIWPLLFLSILSIGTIFERLWFWSTILRSERKTVDQILDAARRDWDEATHLARQAGGQPMGRFLYTPLRLANKEPEIFRLALEASADEELNSMRRGHKVLEAVIALAPLLGLLGTVLGLIHALRDIRLGDIGSSSLNSVPQGISEALISTATGLIVAVVSLAFYRLFQGLLFHQARIFRRTGNELELTYRQFWLRSQQSSATTPMQAHYDTPRNLPGY